jgi:hypothetical protein
VQLVLQHLSFRRPSHSGRSEVILVFTIRTPCPRPAHLLVLIHGGRLARVKRVSFSFPSSASSTTRALNPTYPHLSSPSHRQLKSTIHYYIYSETHVSILLLKNITPLGPSIQIVLRLPFPTLPRSVQTLKTYRIKTCPKLPVLFPSMNSSVPWSWTFMYESTLTSVPLYSVSPHLRRMMTSSLMLRLEMLAFRCPLCLQRR